MKKFLALVGVAALSFSLSACKEESPSGFAGSWIEQNTSATQPHYVKINADSGLYHVEEKISVGGVYKVLREVAKVEGENVLSVKNGFRKLTLENGVLYYRTKSFVRVP